MAETTDNRKVDIILGSTPEHLFMVEKIYEHNANAKKPGWMEWMHYQNPLQETFISLAITPQNTASSVFGLLPVLFKVEDKTDKGCQIIDLLTDKDYRGIGLFYKVANTLFEDAKKKGYKFAYGFPNTSSWPGFVKNFQFKLVDDVPFIIKPLRSKYFTDLLLEKLQLPKFLPNINLSSRKKIRLEKNLRLEEFQSFCDEFTVLWNEFSKDIQVAVNRDAYHLNWRYKRKPQNIESERYRCFALYQNGSLKGYLVHCVKEKHSGRVGYIMEFVYKDKAYGRILMRNAINLIIATKADTILSWCFPHSPSYPLYKKTGFRKLVKSLRPIKLHFGAVTFDSTYNDLYLNSKNWYLSYSDSDTV